MLKKFLRELEWDNYWGLFHLFLKLVMRWELLFISLSLTFQYSYLKDSFSDTIYRLIGMIGR